ncbi:MAG: 50S ribosomal protein L11 methyltransferase [Chloroflexi bacterium]|nr:50S ribosomal protein L11 methyltransferase [Chloroflexota bacterium]
MAWISGTAMDWLEITSLVDVESVEAVCEIFRRHVHGGVSIEEDVSTFPDSEGYTVNLDKPVAIRGYIPLDERAHAKAEEIDRALWHLGLLRPVQPLSTRVVADSDWQNAWKDFFHVHRVGKRFVIKPSWRDFEAQADDLVVEIDPGMAFGTGLHPTTQMCLFEIEHHVKPGQRILDLGTGSGILAIAAARMGAQSVLALDIDAVAVDSAKSNVDLNGLQDVVRVAMGSLPLPPAVASSSGADQDAGDGKFDLILANIIAKVIVELSGHLASAARQGGLVIASGIIVEKASPVEESLTAAGFSIVSRAQRGDWIAFVARKL